MTLYAAPTMLACDLCTKPGELVGVSVHGIAAYRCPNDHVSLVDVSDPVRGPVRVAPTQQVLE